MKRKPPRKRKAVRKRKGKTPSLLRRMTRGAVSVSLRFCFLLAGLVALSLLFLSLYEYLLSSPYVKLRKVVVRGVDEGLKQDLLKTSQLSPDTSLLALRLDELKQRIEGHPWIRSASLKKRFPNTLLIWAEKEKPAAIVLMGDLHYMNQWGKIFKKVNKGADVDFPLVTGISGNAMKKTEQLELVARVLRMLQAEKAASPLGELSEIHVGSSGRLYLYFISMPAVVEMNGNDLDRKMQELRRLVTHLSKRGRLQMVKRINLDYKDGAVVSFRRAEALS